MYNRVLFWQKIPVATNEQVRPTLEKGHGHQQNVKKYKRKYNFLIFL